MGIGLEHFFFSQFIPVVVPLRPAWIPGRLLWIYLVGATLFVAGGLIVSGQKARFAATLMGVFFLLSVVLLHIPENIMAGPLHLGLWTNAFKALALSGSALVVAANLPEAGPRNNRSSSSITGLPHKPIALGMYPLAIMVIVFGVDHFIYLGFVASLVPAWIPGHIFWAYFAGAALVAAGVGMILRIQARLAATLLGVMIFTWILVLIPRAVADPYGAIGNEWTSVWEALAFSGIAFILGQTLSARDGRR